MSRPDPVVELFGGGTPATRAEVPISYMEVPEESTPAMRAYADLVLQMIEARSPWRSRVSRGLLPADITKYQQGRGGGTTTGLADPTVNITGPSALPGGYWMPVDHSAPTPPTDVAWTAIRAITPRELLAISTLTDEQYAVLTGFDGIDDKGQPIIGDRLRVDPIVVMALAGAVLRSENLALAQGAGTNADPVTGLANMSGFNTQAATANLVDDLIEAVFELAALKRPPNAALVPVRFAKKLRKLKGATGGSYLLEVNEPLAIAYGPGEEDICPIIPFDGLPNTAGSTCYIGDFSKLFALQRLMPNGKLLMVAESAFGSTFSTDRVTVRLTERLDFGVVPGFEPSFTRLTGVDAS